MTWKEWERANPEHAEREREDMARKAEVSRRFQWFENSDMAARVGTANARRRLEEWLLADR